MARNSFADYTKTTVLIELISIESPFSQLAHYRYFILTHMGIIICDSKTPIIGSSMCPSSKGYNFRV